MQRTNWNIKQSTFDQDQNIFSTLLVQIIIYSTANNNSNETKKSILMSLLRPLHRGHPAADLSLNGDNREPIEDMYVSLC